jgi:hypothetical protein
METTKRFPQGFGNLAKNSEIPTFAQPRPDLVKERRTEDQRTTTRSTTEGLSRRQLMAGFEVSINGRFSGVHRGEGGPQ